MLSSEDCTPEEVLDEFEPLSSLLLKLLNSPLIPLRHVAQNCYLAVARTIWTSDSEPARLLLISGLQSVFHTYATKKNTRIAQKFVEALIVTRLSDIAVPLIWKDLIVQLGTTQHSHLRSELTHIFTSVIRKYHGLGSEAQTAVRQEFAWGLSVLAAHLTALISDNATQKGNQDEKKKGAGSSHKAIKALVSDVKDIVDFLKIGSSTIMCV